MKNHRLEFYTVGQKRVYFWTIEDENGSTKTLTLKDFQILLKEYDNLLKKQREMKQKTPMQELRERLKHKIETQVKFKNDYEEGVAQGLEDAIDLVESMLGKEEGVMCQFAESFVETKCEAYIDENEPNGCALNWIQTPLDYYEETFKTK